MTSIPSSLPGGGTEVWAYVRSWEAPTHGSVCILGPAAFLGPAEIVVVLGPLWADGFLTAHWLPLG